MHEAISVDAGRDGGAVRPGARLLRVLDAFAWPLRTSHYLELVNPLWATHSLRARVEEVHDEAAGARTLRLRPSPSWRQHRAGQYVRVGVQIDGSLHSRAFSIASSPDRADGCIEITVKEVAGGRVTPYLVRQIEPGDYLMLSPAAGEFTLAEGAPQRLLFITAGSGITPVMSMLRTLDDRGAMPDIVHLHYAPRREDVIFGDELEALAARHPRYALRLAYTRECPTAGARHFDGASLERLCPDWRARVAYACGPRALLEDVEAQWRRAGCDGRLTIERFHAMLATPPADARGGRARFVDSDVEVRADGVTSLLRVAEDAGLNPPHGCRMGICHSCTATLVSGCVRDLRTNQSISEPGSRVQICVCAAAGDVELAL